MRKIIKILFVFLIAAFIVIQFFQPKKNSDGISENHIFEQEIISDEIKSFFTNACLDCHSNETNYLWYHKIAPVSWMVNQHIEDGKKHLNLSNWGEFDIFDKIGALDEICDEVEDEKMPLKVYIIMHKKAKLTKEQVFELCAWTEKLSEELLTEK